MAAESIPISHIEISSLRDLLEHGGWLYRYLSLRSLASKEDDQCREDAIDEAITDTGRLSQNLPKIVYSESLRRVFAEIVSLRLQMLEQMRGGKGRPFEHRVKEMFGQDVIESVRIDLHTGAGGQEGILAGIKRRTEHSRLGSGLGRTDLTQKEIFVHGGDRWRMRGEKRSTTAMRSSTKAGFLAEGQGFGNPTRYATLWRVENGRTVSVDVTQLTRERVDLIGPGLEPIGQSDRWSLDLHGRRKYNETLSLPVLTEPIREIDVIAMAHDIQYSARRMFESNQT